MAHMIQNDRAQECGGRLRRVERGSGGRSSGLKQDSKECNESARLSKRAEDQSWSWVMSDKMQMQQCCVVVTVRLGRAAASQEERESLGQALACGRLASVKSGPVVQLAAGGA